MNPRPLKAASALSVPPATVGPPERTEAAQGDVSKSKAGEARTLRAYRYALDPTPNQVEALARHAGAARFAFNHALGEKLAVHRAWQAARDRHLAAGLDEPAARKAATAETPRAPLKPSIQKAFQTVRGDSRIDSDGIAPWWWEVNTYAFQSAFADADRAWSNWLASLSGQRAGRRVGYPRFKKKATARQAFRLHHDVKRPGIRLEGYRRLRLPVIGSVRIHGSGKRLVRVLARDGGVVQSVTVSRGGHRWYASVLVAIPVGAQPAGTRSAPTQTQRVAGAVGVDLGVRHLATLSTGEHLPNPRHLRAAEKRLKKAQRALSRTDDRGSNRRSRARARLGRRHHELAVRRASALHQVTKRLAANWETVAVEDLAVAGMTATARGTLEKPGHNVRAKAGLNRSILDASFGELRRQLDYKTRWYGSQIRIVDRWAPTSKTCSDCGWRNPSLPLSERCFTCQGCGLVIDRDHNAAINIQLAATDPTAWQRLVASGTGETQNARGAAVRPSILTDAGHATMKREDPLPGSPSTSDRRPLPTLASMQVN